MSTLQSLSTATGKPLTKAIEVLNGIAQKIAGNEKQELIKIAKTAMQTKLVSKESDELAQIVVDAAPCSV